MNQVTWIVTTIAGVAVFIAVVARGINLRRQEQAAHRAVANALQTKLEILEAKLEVTAAEYGLLIGGCGAGVIVLDATDTIERASPEAYRLLGAQNGQLEGKSVLQATLSENY